MNEEKMSSVPQFNGQHYDHWSELMENILRAKGLWSLFEDGLEEPRDGVALTDAQRITFEQVLDKSNSKVIWDSLKLKFRGNERVKQSLLNTLRQDFEVLEMKKEEITSEYFTRVMLVTNQMRSNGEEIPNSKIVQKILRTLTERFTYVVVSIEESKNTISMSVDELQSSLAVHEQKFKRMEQREDQVLKVSTKGRTKGRSGRSPNRGRGRRRGRQPFDKSLIECHRCHNLGHFQYECPTWEGNYAGHDEKEEMLLMAQIDFQEHIKEDVWFLDSGCSNHMSGDLSTFMQMDYNCQ
ncbi:hypothetical protein Lser_V15G32689 [Lactuca serriola]